MTKTKFFFILFFALSAQGLVIPSCEEGIKNFEGYSCVSNKDVGSGASAIVYKVLDPKGVEKLLKMQKMESKADREKVRKEVQILMKLKHPNIVRLFRTAYVGGIAFYILEFAKRGNLKNMPMLTDKKEALKLFGQIVDAVNYMHKNNWVHGDLKAENIVITEENKPLVIDFDLSTNIGEISEPRGSIPYMDTAMLMSDDSKVKMTTESDIYSLGVILYELLHKKLPFKFDSIKGIKTKLNKGDYEIREGIDADIIQIIHECLLRDPNKRMGLNGIKTMIENALKNDKENKLNEPVILSNKDVLPARVSSIVSSSAESIHVSLPESSIVEGEAEKEQNKKSLNELI